MDQWLEKWALGVAAALGILVCSCMSASGMEVYDNCNSLSSAFGRYFNFSLSKNTGEELNLSHTPHQASLSMLSPGADAVALYEVGGASAVEVSIYSKKGTFATDNGAGTYCLGAPSQSLLQNGRQRLRYSRAADTVYLQRGGQVLTPVLQPDGTLAFTAGSASMGATVWYGLTVWVSHDGISFSEAEMLLTDVEILSTNDRLLHYYYETYWAFIPTGARYIKLTLNDYQTVFRAQQEPLTNTDTGSQRLAQVVFTGAALTVGPWVGQTSSSFAAEQDTDTLETLLEKLLDASKAESSASRASSQVPVTTTSKSSSSKAAAASRAPSSRTGASPAPEETAVMNAYAVESIEHVVQGTAEPDGGGIIFGVVYMVAAAGMVGLILYRGFWRKDR